MSERGSGTNGVAFGRASRLAAAAVALALALGAAAPATVAAQDADYESVAGCYAADEGLGTCIELFLPEPPAPPAVDDGDDDDENGAGFDPANLLPGLFGDDEN